LGLRWIHPRVGRGAALPDCQGNAPVAITKTGPDGAFNIEAPPGSYALEIWADGFEKVVAGYICSRRQQPPLKVNLSSRNHQEGSSGRPEPDQSHPDNNQTRACPQEDDIQICRTMKTSYQLSDQLAGPRGGRYGRVHSLSMAPRWPDPTERSIKEIRINNNPFTTELQPPASGGIEIVTKPGTGKMRGNFNFNFRNDALNATQFNAPVKLPYQRQNFQGNVSGPLIHDNWTMTVLLQRNDGFNTTIIRH